MTMQAEATMVVKLGYRGAAYSGFAEQKDPAVRTVAGEVRRALELILRREVELVCAGRTDAGVHAIAQYVSLPIFGDELALDGRRVVHSLVGITPDDIAIYGLYRAGQGFSARFDALRRHYRYRLVCGEAAPIMAQGTAWWLRSINDLDVEAMHEAAQLLLGEHDFKSFCKASSAVGKPTRRCVTSIDVCEVEECGERLIAVDVCGNAFLHSMVRTMVGTLVEVGRGHRNPAWVAEVLDACDRRAAGACAPAKGLTFQGVDYPAGSFEEWCRA
jgi:tRNA pseudouridine38-40 synthase